MKRRTHRVRRQVLLFPAGAKGETAPANAKSAIVQVLADLLLEALSSMGFANVTTIDDDLGRSGSGLVERPGFQRLVASVCSGSVGAVFCIEASRLARNGREEKRGSSSAPTTTRPPRRTSSRSSVRASSTASILRRISQRFCASFRSGLATGTSNSIRSTGRQPVPASTPVSSPKSSVR